LKKNVDFTEVIEAANSQPYLNIHKPGISVGGHCIPVYPQFYIHDNADSKITKAARERNLSMPQIAVDRIKRRINSFKDLNVGIFGITYRAGVKEVAFSGSLDLLRILKQQGAVVYEFDPFYSKEEIIELGFSFQLNPTNLDGIFIHTSHPDYLKINYDVMPNLKFIFDGRNFIDQDRILNKEVIFMNFENC
jgi:UDP-N-acetyl-D-glucosamine dehydrogenase